MVGGTAKSQNLLVIRDLLEHVINVDLPAFISRARRCPAPIIDASSSLDELRREDPPDTIASIYGLKKLQADLVREHERVAQFTMTPGYEELPPLSTNAPYLLAVFSEMLSARSVIAVCKNYVLPSSKPKRAPRAKKGLASEASVKVDVVSNDGRKWTRINTVTSDRFIRELYELDGSGASSSEEEETNPRDKPTPPRTNSLITMGEALLSAAQHNGIPGSPGSSPEVHIRLTRLALVDEPPADNDGSEDEESFQRRDVASRIEAPVSHLRSLGIHINIGERPFPTPPTPRPRKTYSFVPTRVVNLDLSILIALCSDISHAEPPVDEAAALMRFKPLIRRWKKNGITEDGGDKQDAMESDEMGEHSRALASQSLQELRRGLIDSIHERLFPKPTDTSNHSEKVEFWTTPAAKTRCLAILSRIGGPAERARAEALFSSETDKSYWAGSRYEARKDAMLPGAFPVRLLASDTPLNDGEGEGKGVFWTRLRQICASMLSQRITKPPHDLAYAVRTPPPSSTSSTTKVTTHTAESLLWGAYMGSTTLTANRTSVRSVLSGMNAWFGGIDAGEETDDGVENNIQTAAVWIVEPRSLSAGMRTDHVV